MNRNKNHVINLLLHEELSWRLLTKLPESISTFRIVQKMWLQWPFFYTCTKRFGIEEVYRNPRKVISLEKIIGYPRADFLQLKGSLVTLRRHVDSQGHVWTY